MEGRKHLVEILLTEECLRDMRRLYDVIVNGNVPVTFEIGPDDLNRFEDSVKAAFISVLSGCKEYHLPH